MPPTYSTTMHMLVITINGGAIGLLQVVTSQSSAPTNAADRHATLVCCCFFFLVYAILLICEVHLLKQPPIRELAGHISHLFGALSALMLISNVSTIFTLFAAPIWILWFVIVMWISIQKLHVSVPYENANPGVTQGVQLAQLSPV